MRPHLYIGIRNYSSWSMRPWLCLKWAGIDFDEALLDLDQPGYGTQGLASVLAVSPAGKVPALHVGGTVVWDSLAIAEWAAEQPGAKPLWPKESLLRAEARSVTAEMHAGFSGIRRDLAMNIRRRCTATDLPPETLRDIARIDSLWSGLRKRHRQTGTFLFGDRSIADAFYTPVATRFRTYAIGLSSEAQAYCDTLLADAAFKQWEKKALAEWKAPFSRAALDEAYTQKA